MAALPRVLTPEQALLIWAFRELADQTGRVSRDGPSYPTRTLDFMMAVRAVVGDDADSLSVLIGENPQDVRREAEQDRARVQIVDEEGPLDG